MKKYFVYFLPFLLTALPPEVDAQPSVRPVQWVDPFIGTAGGGLCYPGAQAPFGMIQWSPDTKAGSGGANYSKGNAAINSFSLLHLNGVGCTCAGDIPFIPVAVEPEVSPVGNRGTYASPKSDEAATAGYYQVHLDKPDVAVALTTTTRAGIGRFTFNRPGKPGMLVVPPNCANGIDEGEIVIDTAAQKITGWAKSGKFCNSTNRYVVYFCASFDQPFRSYGAWSGPVKKPGSLTAKGNDCAAYVGFDEAGCRTIGMKVGVSFVSVANAELNLQTEIPDWNFEAIKQNTENSWNDYLGKIRVSGGTADRQKMFYTALYHVAQCPSVFEDVDGQYRSIDGSVRKVEAGHHFYATFSMWDTYRTPPQLLALIAPGVCSDQIRSLLRMAQESPGGGLPGWSYYNSDPNVMGTYPAPIFIANGYAFGARDFDAATLKNKLVQCATQPGLKCSSASNGGCSWPELSTYKSLGYRPNKCSDNLELAITDFSIARYCLALGDSANYRYFLNRAQNIFKLVNAEGWMQRKDASGNWVAPFSTTATEGFTEGNSAQYSWDIPFNIAELISRMGGNAAFVRKLDDHLSQYVSGWPTKSPYWWIGNEPGFGVPFKYNWARAPWRTQYHVRNAIDAKFTAKADGLPGNDDTGASSAWLAFAMMGIYPEIPGVGGFTLFSPTFGRVEICLPNGRIFTIEVGNQDPAHRYIRKAKLNGKKFGKTWIDIETVEAGARLQFSLGARPNTRWGSGASDLPPSYRGMPHREQTPLP